MRCSLVIFCAVLLSHHAVSAQELVVPASGFTNTSMVEARLEELELELVSLRSAADAEIYDSKGSCGKEDCCGCCWDRDWYVSVGGAWNARERATEVDAPGTFLRFTDGFAINAALGLRRGMWRVEAESSYLNNYIEFASADIPGVGILAGPADGNIGLQLYMLNVYRDFALTDNIRPYVGAGVGIGQSEINGLRPSIFTGLGLPTEGINATSDWPFAYQLRGGMSYAVGSRTEAFFGYRYVNVSTFEFTHFPFGEFRPNGSRNHHLEVGLRVNF